MREPGEERGTTSSLRVCWLELWGRGHHTLHQGWEQRHGCPTPRTHASAGSTAQLGPRRPEPAITTGLHSF